MKKVIKTLTILVLVLCMAVMPALGVNTMKEDFQGAYAGDTLELLEEMYYYFEGIYATPDSHSEIVELDSGKCMKINGYTDIRTLDYYTSEYVFTVDMMPEEPGRFTGLFVRGEMPGALTKVNPPNAGSTNVFNYYEWDWYKENGGKSGESAIGGSGIGILPGEASITVLIKKYTEDGLTVGTDSYDIAAPASYKSDAFNSYKITDNGKEIKAYIADELLFRVALSTDSTSYETDGTDVSYFKSATIYDGAGTELGTTENTRLNFAGSQIAFTTRETVLYMDNVSLKYGEGAIDGSGSAVTTAPAPSTTTEAPSTSGSTTEGADSTASADTAKPDTTDKNTEEPSKGMDKKTLIIIIAAAAVVVAVVIVIIAIPKKKK